MSGIMSGLGGFGSVYTILTYVAYFVVFLLICAVITALVIMVVIKKSSTKVFEIDMVNKKIKSYNGRNKNTTSGKVKQFFASKITRNLPQFQQRDIFIHSKSKQDIVMLLKDNNGMFHTLRIPTYKQIKKWYSAVYDIDLSKDKSNECDNLRNIYLLPNPHEDLDWLANQISEAKKEFSVNHWWQSPTIAYIGVGFVCLMMIVATMALRS